MYPWYRESVGQFCGPSSPMPTAIKTENGYSDCMLALDYASQSKKSTTFVWSPTDHQTASHAHAHAHAHANGHKCANSAITQQTSSSTSSSCNNTGGGGQGLVHWMSVMAEHMNNAVGNTTHHHDPMHYMWNGVEQCGSHIKDDYGWPRQSAIMKHGYEAKMSHISDHHNQSHQKGLDEGAMSVSSVTTPSPLYNGVGSIQAPRSLSSGGSNSTSPPVAPSGHMLIVPHPISASKLADAHHVVTQNTSGRKYQCKMCPSIFSSKSELQLHSQLHMREVKPYKCSQCCKTFANSSYLSQHTRIHLGIKPYRCEICQRKFTQLSHLQQHIRTHTGDKPYKCRHPGCTKAFSQLSNLQSHSRCHQTDKPYKCNSCYKCFTDETSLLEHIPKHKESKHLKTHICQYCGKSYTQETYLTKHMQKHAERLEKRPPIITIPRVTLDNAHYWPKVSPDTATNLVDAINQQEACLMTDHHNNNNINGQSPDEHHNTLSRLSHSSIPTPPSTSSPLHPYEPLITVSTPPDPIKCTSSSSSAFTPIHSMGSAHHHHNHHLNHHHHHHQISDRSSYLPYNTIAFPGSKIMSSSAGQLTGLHHNSMDSITKSSVNSVPSNAFPNQLISLHQIRNYAHQPAHSLMSTEHFIHGLKDKT